MLIQGVQDFIAKVGAEGCYALTLCKIADITEADEWTIGPLLSIIRQNILKGTIASDMTVLDGAAFLSNLTERRWAKEYKPAGYKPRPGDYLIAEWFNKRTGKTHFTLEYPEKWNSLENSVTVKEGAIRSYRLYRTEEKA
jgi:hypothetical protein